MDEVVEVDVEETVEEKVKEKVVAEKAVRTGQGLRVFLSGQGGGVHPGPAVGPCRLGRPPPPKPRPPPPRPPGDSDLDSLFFDASFASQNFGAGQVVVGGRGGGGVHEDKPLRVGGLQGPSGGVAREEEGGSAPPPPPPAPKRG